VYNYALGASIQEYKAMNIVAFSKKPPMDSRGVSLEDTKPVESSAIAGVVKQENLEVSA
jgi:hypothetical protein